MKIVIAPDKYKGTLSASQACEAIKSGIEAACGHQEADILSVPLADGGEGSMEALVGADRIYKAVRTVDAHGRNIKSHYGIIPDGRCAVIEAAESIGLARLGRFERNPLTTSSYGFGKAIMSAMGEGIRSFVLAIGGTATNDCGVGMLDALGARFYDARGGQIDFPSGGSLSRISQMDLAGLRRNVQGCRFVVACDVSNPLLGEHGAARVYSPQKGADPKIVETLEEGAEIFSSFAAEVTGRDLAMSEMSGAAGGLGWALAMFCDASLVGGARYIGQRAGFVDALAGADLVVTGEGRIDGQTSRGKVVGYVCEEARRRGIPIIAYCGTKGDGVTDGFLDEMGLSRLRLLAGHAGLRESMDSPAETLARTVRETFARDLADLKPDI